MTWMVFSSRIFLELVFCFCAVVHLFFFNKISITFFSKKKCKIFFLFIVFLIIFQKRVDFKLINKLDYLFSLNLFSYIKKFEFVCELLNNFFFHT